MVFGLDTYEKFVKVPGVVEIRYKSDDPEFYAPAVDIFEEQRSAGQSWYQRQEI